MKQAININPVNSIEIFDIARTTKMRNMRGVNRKYANNGKYVKFLPSFTIYTRAHTCTRGSKISNNFWRHSFGMPGIDAGVVADDRQRTPPLELVAMETALTPRP